MELTFSIHSSDPSVERCEGLKKIRGELSKDAVEVQEALAR